MRIKKIRCFLSAVLMLALIPAQAFAGEMDVGDPANMEKNISQEDVILSPVETGELGNITIKLEDSSKNVPKGGVSLAVVRVADVENGEFVLTEEFESTKVDLNQIHTAAELEEAAQKLKAQDTKLITKQTAQQKTILTTDDSGEASLAGLPAGVYLIYATDTAQYDEITSAVVSIPTFDEEAGVMNYDIELFPKHVPVPDNRIVEVVKTGVEDHVLAYAGALVLSFASVVFLVVNAARKDRKTK